MTERLRFFREAAEDIEEERAFYLKRSEEAEASFLHEVDHAIAAVADAPDRWPKYMKGTRRYVLDTFPFSLVYVVEEGVVVVVALEAERKKPGYWKSRLRKRY